MPITILRRSEDQVAVFEDSDFTTVALLQARADRAKRLLDAYLQRNEGTIVSAREAEAKNLDLFPVEARVLRAWRKRLRAWQCDEVVVGHWKYALRQMARGL